MSSEKNKSFVVNPDTGTVSMKRSLVYYTWLWAIITSTAMVVKFIVDPTQVVADAFTGFGVLIGAIFSVAYAGMLVGERNNKDLPPPKIPDFPTANNSYRYPTVNEDAAISTGSNSPG